MMPATRTHLSLCLMSLTLALPLACSPAIVHLPAPNWTPSLTEGRSVQIHFPIDARPPSEQRDGRVNSAIYPISVPVREFHYGDDHLRPSPLFAIWENTRAAVYQRQHPLSDAGDVQVRLFVLHHRGTRDVSDAQWVSTVTGGLAGTVGKFFYNTFAEVQVQVRVQVQEGGRTLAVRDVIITEIERKPVAYLYGFWSLYQRNVLAEMYGRAFTRAHRRLTRQIADIVDEALKDQPVLSGSPVTQLAQHTLHSSWERDDSLDFRARDQRDSARADQVAALKYGSERFSLTTGHDLKRGDTVGRIALPHDTVGYDIGLLDRVQAQLNLTLLGRYNSVGAGVRTQLFRSTRSAYSLELDYHPYFVVAASNGYKPEWVGRSIGAAGLWSFRPSEITWYTRVGVKSRLGRQAVPELNLSQATRTSLIVEPGFELQLTPSLMISLSVRTRADFQSGSLLAPGPLNAFSPVVPVLALGLR